MIKHFYSYIVETDSLFLEIDGLEISSGEKSHLKSLAESHIHHSVLDTVLSELPSGGKKDFLKHLNTKDHEKIWQFLNENIENMEEKIKEAANRVKHELLQDIRGLKQT